MKHPPHYRWSVFSRVIAAFGGGYVLTGLLVAAFSLCWPGNRAVAVLFSTMMSFLIYSAIIIAAFHARSAGRVWLWVIVPSIPLAAVVWLNWRVAT